MVQQAAIFSQETSQAALVATQAPSAFPPLQPPELEQYRLLFSQVDSNRDGMVTVRAGLLPSPVGVSCKPQSLAAPGPTGQ